MGIDGVSPGIGCDAREAWFRNEADVPTLYRFEQKGATEPH